MCKQRVNPAELLTARLLLLNIDLQHSLGKKAPLQLLTIEVAAFLSQAVLWNCRFSSRWGFGCFSNAPVWDAELHIPWERWGGGGLKFLLGSLFPLLPAGVLGCALNSSGCIGKVVSVTVHIWKCEFWNSAVGDLAQTWAGLPAAGKHLLPLLQVSQTAKILFLH